MTNVFCMDGIHFFEEQPHASGNWGNTVPPIGSTALHCNRNLKFTLSKNEMAYVIKSTKCRSIWLYTRMVQRSDVTWTSDMESANSCLNILTLYQTLIAAFITIFVARMGYVFTVVCDSKIRNQEIRDTVSAFCEELKTVEFVADHHLKKIC